MAQDTSNQPQAPAAGSAPPVQETEARGRDERFHYYSGGEVKELADTRVSPMLWVFWTIVIVAAVAFFLFGGALGPKFGGYQPVGGSHAEQANIQNDLNMHQGQLQYASVDLTKLPIPAGQTLDQAIANGTTVYQTYCIGCHGPNQDGNGVNASSLNPKPRNLHDAPFMQAMSYQRITTSVHKGVPGTAMPRWENTLSDTEIGDVIAYVFSLTSPPPGAATATPGGATTQASGSATFAGGNQSSPKPITPTVEGNPAAHTTTAPPSESGAPTTAVGPAPSQVSNPSAPNPGTSPALGTEKTGTHLTVSTPTAGGHAAAPILRAPTSRPAPPPGTPGPGNQAIATTPAVPKASAPSAPGATPKTTP